MNRYKLVFAESENYPQLCQSNQALPLSLNQALVLAAKRAGLTVDINPQLGGSRERPLYFFKAPSTRKALIPLLKRKYIFLCWGTPAFNSRYVVRLFKDMRFRLFLEAAVCVVVNDMQTKIEVEKHRADNVYLVPNFVDTNYFSHHGYNRKANYILAPGDIDRDEELIFAIAEVSNLPVVRVTRDAKVKKLYEGRRSGKIRLEYQCSYHELRDLISNSKLIILPISTQNHAAGQTSLLEALSCGAAVVLTRGATSTVAEQYHTVKVVEGNDVATWCRSVSDSVDKDLAGTEASLSASQEVHRVHGLDPFLERFDSIFKSATM